MILANAKIYTMDNDQVIDSGYIVIENGKIKDVGDMKNCPLDKDVKDLKGKMVFPGFIDAHCHVGILEDGLTFEGDDVNESTDPVTPQIRGIDAINPMDVCFREALMAGVTTVATGPGSANVIGGTFAILKTYGNCVDDMIVKENAAMKFAFGENPKGIYNQKGQTPMTRMGAVALIREQLLKAKEYLSKLEDYENDPEENEKPDFDIKCESLIPLLKGEMPMKAHAHRADDIFSAIRIAREFNLSLTIDHCTEGHLIKDALGEYNYPCLVGPSLIGRSKPELKNKTYSTPKELYEKGVSVSIITDHDVIPLEHLTICAALSYKAGLPYMESLKAITINPAKALGIDDKVGSIKVGCDADIVVFSSDPLDILSSPKMVIINGLIIKEDI
ncbi:MAG: amidohydrolase [Clostridia bacterium]|nr:amidohydrolase [Oscillospiraceae bacterium]MBR4893239.1 amidohydrolase [Clostridia bacterium]